MSSRYDFYEWLKRSPRGRLAEDIFFSGAFTESPGVPSLFMMMIVYIMINIF